MRHYLVRLNTACTLTGHLYLRTRAGTARTRVSVPPSVRWGVINDDFATVDDDRFATRYVTYELACKDADAAGLAEFNVEEMAVE